MSDPSVKIIVAAHKECWTPKDGLYLPVHVGAAGKQTIEGFQRDDQGENISHLNAHYCELTGLYWAWKNCDVDYLGLVHYRRYFKGDGENGTLSSDQAQKLLTKAPVVLPKKRVYGITTVENHYASTMDPTHMDLVREALGAIAPEYSDAFDAHMRRRAAHIWNMSIMRRDYLDSYCRFLFPVLDYIDQQVDYADLTAFEARLIGRLSERLLDPWLQVNDVSFVEHPVISLDGSQIVKKVYHTARALFIGERYKRSF